MRLWIAAALFSALCFAEDRASITGKVIEASGKPVEHATVLVYEAGVKKGYGVLCPTCWVDCGKRVTTTADGTYTIPGLNRDLWFTLLVLRDGYASIYLRKADPAKGPAEDAVLHPRAPVADASQVVRGRIVDTKGKPVRDAVVEQQGVTTRRPDGQVGTRFGGNQGWIDALAVSNENGEFEIAFGQPAIQMILLVTPRGLAPKLFTESTGNDRKTMTVTDGALIRGRLLHNGKPVTGVQVGLVTHQRAAGTTYNEVRIGTREDGTFAITNVPLGRIWLLYPKMESLVSANIGADPVACESRDDGQEVDLGDIELKPAHILHGKVVLSDGKPIPPDMHMTLSADSGWDNQITAIASDGSFEFRALPPGIYELGPGVKGYGLSEGRVIEALVNRDISDFIIRLSPEGLRR